MMKSRMLSVLSGLLFVLSVLGQVTYDPTPFDIIGTINGMTLDTAGGPLAGGTTTVDGLSIVVPKNLLATLPSIAVAWGELFKSDRTTPNLPGTVVWEANVVGNRVNGQFIAGLVYIAQRSTQIVQGFITSIDLSTGHFKINGPGLCDQRPHRQIRSALHGESALASRPRQPEYPHPDWIPSMHPKGATDPPCPSKNRALDLAGKPLGVFTFKDPATIVSTDPDARLMAPLLVGDYVDVSGTVTDNGLLEVSALNVNLQFLTAPGKKPAYLWVEEAIFAVVTTQGGEAGETRAVAWTSDPTTPIQWFAVDVHPCLGDATERNLVLQQPTSAGAPLGRAVYRMAKVDASPATRQVGFRVATGATVTSNNVTAGQYLQPIFSYPFPELTAFGTPVFPNSFDLIPYLATGSGPYVPGTFGATPPTPEIVSSSKDTITIISASQASSRGVITVSVSAKSSNANAVLSLSVAGPNPITATPMTKSGTASSLSISVKSKGTSVTVTSQFGGSASVAI
ncbi:hypothetical protein LZ554_002480 [Drepanopeziza brunnea f. sp. 'monogermtubi']|nr:hypothetical protein LZ554_002480 [Drepanopeziza brunnea f. sp. 'monogermtubi']